jgi:Flp pilus assembly protein TadD, contains TPR repeats
MKKLLKISGDNYKVYNSYAISQAEFGNFDAAIKLYEKAIDEKPDLPNAYMLLGNLYSDLGKFDLAHEQYNKLIDLNRKDAVAYMSQGNAYYMQNNIEKALVSYRDAIKTAPDNDEYKLVYIQILDEYIDRKEN